MSPLALVIFAGIMSAAMIWFLRHCAEPELRYHRAPALAHRIVLLVTVAAIATLVLRAAVAVLARDAEILYAAASIVGLTWCVVVGLGYLVKYGPLVWACRAIGQGAR